MAVTTYSTWYKIRFAEGIGRLDATYKTLKEAKEAIDKITWSETQPRTQFLITKTEQELTMTDKGKFMKKITTETSVQVYPKK